MLHITLDTNAIIDLEEDREDGIYVAEIVQAWRSNQIDLSVVAVSASEKQLGGGINETFEKFEAKLNRIKLDGVTILLPPAFWDVFYWDHALWPSQEMENLKQKIQEIMFPEMLTDFSKNKKSQETWRSKFCDILIAVSHAYHGQDILVTRDHHFHDNKVPLELLGVHGILTPREASELCKPA